jgi:anti-sigma-K factor RskA
VTHDEAADLVALYVVDALSPAEREGFEAHLASCTECREEVAGMRDVSARLSHSVEAEPPASLRSSLLAQVAATPQDSPVSASAGNVVAMPQRAARRFPYLLAAAAVLAAVGFGGWAAESRQNAEQAASAQQALVSLLGASDVRTVSGTTSNGAAGTVVLSRARDRAVFVTAGMPSLPDDRVYELWTIADRPVPAGTFRSDGDSVVVDLPAAALSAPTIAVTVEPSGGSAQPTTTPIIALRVPRAS